MPENFSLMAHLVPKLKGPLEDAATDALAYILTNSASSRQTLNDLLREGGFAIEPIVKVATQVTHPDNSRPDMTGYDKNSQVRLVVEAKFGAALGDEQASAYAQLFDRPGPAVLLFIAPERRIPILWAAIEQQMKELGELEYIESFPGAKRARVLWKEPRDIDLQLIATSWLRLIERMGALEPDDDIRSDINQLRGLAQREDTRVFLPIHAKELSPDFPRRVVAFNQLIDDVVDGNGVPKGWLEIKGLQATSRRYGYGRYCRFVGLKNQLWFGVNHERWAESADTPLWLRIWDLTGANEDEIGRIMNVKIVEGIYDSGKNSWIPIHLKTGIDYNEVLDGVASQLRKIGETLVANQTSCESSVPLVPQN